MDDATAADALSHAADVVVYCKGLTRTGQGSAFEATGLLHSRIVVDGREIGSAMGIQANAEGGEFASVTLRINVRSVRFVALGPDDFARDDLSNFEPDTSSP